jgi:hypothetical protein
MNPSAPGKPEAPPFPGSLCHRCVHAALVEGARSNFLKCEHPELPRYRRQPVLACGGFAPAEVVPGAP